MWFQPAHNFPCSEVCCYSLKKWCTADFLSCSEVCCYSLKTWCTADFLLLNDILEPCAAVQGWFGTLLSRFYSQMALLNQFNLLFQIVNSRNASSDEFVKISAASVSGVGSWTLMPASWPVWYPTLVDLFHLYYPFCHFWDWVRCLELLFLYTVLCGVALCFALLPHTLDPWMQLHSHFMACPNFFAYWRIIAL